MTHCDSPSYSHPATAVGPAHDASPPGRSSARIRRESGSRRPALGMLVQCVCLGLACSACNDSNPDDAAANVATPVLDKTTAPVTGRIVVDGEPVDKLLVNCHRVDDADVPAKSFGLTDADGTVTFSTFEAADGVPPGEYVLTFEWRDWDDYWKRHEGPDKFDGRYSDPETSNVELTVVNGESTDLGLLELSTE